MGKICPYCKETNEDTAKFCTGCGAPLQDEPVAGEPEVTGPETAGPEIPEPQVTEPEVTQPAAEEKPYEEKPVMEELPPVSQNSYSQSSYSQSSYKESFAPVPIGGLTAWAIIIILFCTIPGIVALVKVRNINNAPTFAEQQQRLSSAKTWLIVGTVLGVLSLFSLFGRAMMNSTYSRYGY